jgi:hypothetical protein
MAVLLVDGRDDRVIEAFADWGTAAKAIDQIEMDDPAFAEGLYLVEFHERGSAAVIRADSSFVARSLI